MLRNEHSLTAVDSSEGFDQNFVSKLNKSRNIHFWSSIRIKLLQLHCSCRGKVISRATKVGFHIWTRIKSCVVRKYFHCNAMLSQPKSEQKREQLSKSKRCFIIFASTFLFLFVIVLVQIFYKTPWNWMNSRKLEIWGNEILLDVICLSMGDLLKSTSSKIVLKSNFNITHIYLRLLEFAYLV